MDENSEIMKWCIEWETPDKKSLVTQLLVSVPLLRSCIHNDPDKNFETQRPRDTCPACDNTPCHRPQVKCLTLFQFYDEKLWIVVAQFCH